MDIHACYEVCVQRPRVLAAFLAGVHARGDDGGKSGEPRAAVLHEHFSGTAALGRRWIADGRAAGVERGAVAVDIDAAVLQIAAERARDEGVSDRLELVNADVLEYVGSCGETGGTGQRRAADVIFVGNFSIGYIHERRVLVEYLAACRGVLARGGVFVCDTYDGESMYREGGVTRVVPWPQEPGTQVRYTWEQREADRLTAQVTSVLHFQVERGGEVVVRHADAFVYRWRLWSIAELREAMREAGFAVSEVYQRLDTPLEPLMHGRDVSEAGIVCVVAR